MGTINLSFPFLPVNHFAFGAIDSAAKAYLLGMILSDGNVRAAQPRLCSARVNIKILATDIQACRMAQEVVGGCLRYMEGGYRVVWEVTSNQVAADLLRLGITPRKTHTASLNWDLIPPALHGAVLAGIIDGDGHLRFNQKDRRAEISLVTASQALRDQLLRRFPFFKLAVTPAKAGRCELYTVKVENNRELLVPLIESVYDRLPFPILQRKQAVLDQIRGYLAEQEAYDKRMGHVAAMKEGGMTIAEIATHMGTSRRPIQERLKAAGVNSKVVVFTDDDRQEIKRLHAGGLSVLQIHAVLGKGTEQAVRFHLQRMGCIPPPQRDSPGKTHADASVIAAAFRNGKTAQQIASERKMCPRVVCRILREAGVSLRRGSARKLEDEQVAWAVGELSRGRTLRSVAQELGVSETLIRIRRKRLAVPMEGGLGAGQDERQPEAAVDLNTERGWE